MHGTLVRWNPHEWKYTRSFSLSLTHTHTFTSTRSGVCLLVINTSNSHLLFSCYLSLPQRVGQLISSEPRGVITQGPMTYKCDTRAQTHTHAYLRHPDRPAGYGACSESKFMSSLFVYCTLTAPRIPLVMKWSLTLEQKFLGSNLLLLLEFQREICYWYRHFKDNTWCAGKIKDFRIKAGRWTVKIQVILVPPT